MGDEDLRALLDATKDDPLLSPYPGGREPVNRVKKDPPPAPPDWDTKPTILILKGKEREFFTIGDLATALGRSVVTIRSWENKGVLPKTPYRSPTPKGPPRQSIAGGGTPTKGRRLWTREQIEGILRICHECRVIIDPKRRPPSEEFTFKVAQLFVQLLNEDRDGTTQP